MPKIRKGFSSSNCLCREKHSAQDVTEHALALFHPITASWFRAVFHEPTAPQIEGWPAIARGESTLILAPTGTGKTLTAFLLQSEGRIWPSRSSVLKVQSTGRRLQRIGLFATQRTLEEVALR